ncbi:MAG: dihydrofolate reductase [Candidatus Omnitrophica bacterium]|nr:dihydrofolate reductase [Candidatus Omnitrophota bacterium]
MKKFNIVVAIDKNNGIGKSGHLPWHISADLKYFKQVTTFVLNKGASNAVIMGRKTWESIPKNFQPLKDRINVVLTRNNNLKLPKDVLNANGLDEALKILENKGVDNIFVIGGQQVYEQAIEHKACEKLYITRIDQTFDCDAHFPKFDDRFYLVLESPQIKSADISFKFLIYKKCSN